MKPDLFDKVYRDLLKLRRQILLFNGNVLETVTYDGTGVTNWCYTESESTVLPKKFKHLRYGIAPFSALYPGCFGKIDKEQLLTLLDPKLKKLILRRLRKLKG